MKQAYSQTRSCTTTVPTTTTPVLPATKITVIQASEPAIRIPTPVVHTPIIEEGYDEEHALAEADAMEAMVEGRIVEAPTYTPKDAMADCAGIMAWMACNPTQGPDIHGQVTITKVAPTPVPIPKCTPKATWTEKKLSLGGRIRQALAGKQPTQPVAMATNIVEVK
jgi:hypothetical protein